MVDWPLGKLMEAASQLTKKASGNRVELCAIINIRSGHCGMDCHFCSQSVHNRAFKDIYPLLPEADLQHKIMRLSAQPLSHIGLVASGAALAGAEFDRLLNLISALPREIRPRICVSLGRISEEQMRLLREAGVRRYHHNLETSREYYPSICSTQKWEERASTIRRAQACGLETCSGALFGMGESWQDRIALAKSLINLNVTKIPLNFLHPQPGTPLAKRKPLTVEEALRIICIFRHISPNATLRVCGGRPITFGQRQKEIFAAGANALMTGDYLTTKGSVLGEDLAMLEELELKNDFSV